MGVPLAVIAALAALAAAWFGVVRRLLNRARQVARATIVSPEEPSTMSEGGAVRTVQAADLTMDEHQLEAI
ncbi:MAG: hypothetical protein H0U33_09720, partial [Solirubrobacterales bacterium]|nr:hypothetical protein [Solirubrobacterales bacterium]